MTPSLKFLPILICVAALAACDGPPPTPAAAPANPPAQMERADASPATAGNELKQRQMEFLNHIREADPQQRTIDRAMLNEQNELGLILDRSVEMDKVPTLLKAMLAQMAKAFPGQDLTVLAYTPSEPPHKIGTAHLDAQTRDMTYTAAQ